MNKSVLVALGLLSMVSECKADSMTIQMKDGSVQTYNTNKIQRIVFDSEDTSKEKRSDGPSGELSGIGGDGKRYTSRWSGNSILRPTPVYGKDSSTGQPFIHFTLNGSAWPDAGWGIEQATWSVTCFRGGELSGIGGDGKRYTSRWSGNSTLQPTPVYGRDSSTGQPFLHFTLNGNAWPDAGWGIEQATWSITCNQ